MGLFLKIYERLKEDLKGLKSNKNYLNGRQI